MSKILELFRFKVLIYTIKNSSKWNCFLWYLFYMINLFILVKQIYKLDRSF